MGFMYFSEIYLKWRLSKLELYLEKVEIYLSYTVLLESVFSLLYGRGGASTHLLYRISKKTQVKKKLKQQMLPHII